MRTQDYFLRDLQKFGYDVNIPYMFSKMDFVSENNIIVILLN